MNAIQSLLLVVSAGYSIAFAIFHLCFWRIFDWRNELGHLTHINRGVVLILNLCLTFVFVLFAYIMIAHGSEMVTTAIGRSLLAGISLFWFLRMFEQVLFFGLKRPVPIAFTVVFLIGTVLNILPLYV